MCFKISHDIIQRQLKILQTSDKYHKTFQQNLAILNDNCNINMTNLIIIFSYSQLSLVII